MQDTTIQVLLGLTIAGGVQHLRAPIEPLFLSSEIIRANISGLKQQRVLHGALAQVGNPGATFHGLWMRFSQARSSPSVTDSNENVH